MLLLQAAALLLLAALVAGGQQRTEVGPPVCHPDCPKYGTCSGDGFCKCPFGRKGEACEIDELAPCRQMPDGEAYCESVAFRSCECLKRCRAWFCPKDSQGREWCHWFFPPPDRKCFRRGGVAPDQQFSRAPGPDESVKCFSGYLEGAEEVPCSEAAVLETPWEKTVSLPLTKCPDQCNMRGYCLRDAGLPEDAPGRCVCPRGFEGASCEQAVNVCPNKCNGRGTCRDHYCHCEPPYFSIDCSRSKVHPPGSARPSAIDFKIYMYELPTWLVYENADSIYFRQHNEIYIAYQKFIEQLLLSPVRTENPWEANLFFLPALTFTYSGNGGAGSEHLHLVIDYVRQAWPFWNASQGLDHVIFTNTDRGACDLRGPAENAIKIVHFGMSTTAERHAATFPHLGHPQYGCTHPLRDVVATPYDPIDRAWLANTAALGVDELLALKERTFFFAGGILPEAPEYSGNSRQIAYKHVKEWNDPNFVMYHRDTPEGYNYETYLRASKFCMAPLGWGWGNRVLQVMMAGCVPVIVQEYSLQANEDVLPYEAFSIRLNNEDLPHLRDILNGVSAGQYRRLLENVLRYNRAFAWDPEVGGQAFQYTVSSLRRRWLNLKAMYYDVVYNETGAPAR